MANAAIETGTDTSPAAWVRSFAVNVMANAHAADQLLPGRLERGVGRLAETNTAAGLLTKLGWRTALGLQARGRRLRGAAVWT